jgi:hypothetical protein
MVKPTCLSASVGVDVGSLQMICAYGLSNSIWLDTKSLMFMMSATRMSNWALGLLGLTRGLNIWAAHDDALWKQRHAAASSACGRYCLMRRMLASVTTPR